MFSVFGIEKMLPADVFRFCPRCGAARFSGNAGKIPLLCKDCGFTFYFNPTVSAAALIFDARGRALFIRRTHEPAKGKLGIPGGFIDIGESAEVALRRELREEVGLDVEEVSFLCSFPNNYHFREVTYPVLDLVFTARALNPQSAHALDGVDSLEWHLPSAVDTTDLAFESIREGLRHLNS